MESDNGMPEIVGVIDGLSSKRQLYPARKVVTDLFNLLTFRGVRMDCLMRQVSVAQLANDNAWLRQVGRDLVTCGIESRSWVLLHVSTAVSEPARRRRPPHEATNAPDIRLKTNPSLERVFANAASPQPEVSVPPSASVQLRAPPLVLASPSASVQ